MGESMGGSVLTGVGTGEEEQGWGMGTLPVHLLS